MVARVNCLNRFSDSHSFYEKTKWRRRKKRGGKLIMELVASNVVASWLPKRQPTAQWLFVPKIIKKVANNVIASQPPEKWLTARLVQKSYRGVVWRCRILYAITKLQLMILIDFWQKFTLCPIKTKWKKTITNKRLHRKWRQPQKWRRPQKWKRPHKGRQPQKWRRTQNWRWPQK